MLEQTKESFETQPQIAASIAHKLRVLIVDDNQINLSVLSTLLKRRFSSLLDGPPVTVDSGLKAIQLLRIHVFDLILMDIQMPFLSGLDATIRIRNGEDDVLEANANAHIVAVTTAVGVEPEAAYRRAGMDGMIGKPVRFQDMQHYLTPLAREAQHAAQWVKPTVIDGVSIMQPLPPVSRYERIFYLPADATIRAPCPDICKGADFESMLRAQTRASLRKSGAMAIGRGATIATRSPTRRLSVLGHVSHKGDSVNCINEEENIGEANLTTGEQEPNGEANLSHGRTSCNVTQPSAASTRRHARNNTMTISKFMLSEQIKREMDNLEGHDSGHDSDPMETSHTSSNTLMRPVLSQRASSPAWLMSLGDKEEQETPCTPECNACLSEMLSLARPSRPKWLLALNQKFAGRSQEGKMVSRSSSLSCTSDEGDPLTPFQEFVIQLPRDFQTSVGSSISDEPPEISTPSSETETWGLSGFDNSQKGRCAKHTCQVEKDKCDVKMACDTTSQPLPQLLQDEVECVEYMAIPRLD